MAEFVVTGPYEVKVKTGPAGGREIDESRLKDLEGKRGFSEKGCYVFSSRVAIYVGKTEKSTIRYEAFNARNLLEINKFLNSRQNKPTLRIFLITPDGKKGDAKSIGHIESFLISKALRASRHLLNTQGIRGGYIANDIVIKGIVGHGQGAPTTAAKELKKVLKI